MAKTVAIKKIGLTQLEQIFQILQNNRSLFDGVENEHAKGYREAVDDCVDVIRQIAGLPQLEEEP